jgi:hypothetical protein
MNVPKIFKLGDCTYIVKQKKRIQEKFKPDTAYLLSSFNDYVYPFRSEIDDPELAYQPGIYLYKGRPYVIRPRTEEDKIKYSKNRIIELTPDCIFKDLSDDIIEPPVEILTDGDIFKPSIKDTDDIALAGMKYSIGQKNINFNTYADRFPDMATKNNGRRALTHGNTLKMDMLTRFASVFDINAAIAFWDKKGCKNPMAKDYNKVFVIFNDDTIDFKDPDIEIEEITRE